jgi:hypothetical protein
MMTLKHLCRRISSNRVMKYSLAFLGEGWLYCHMEHDWQKDYRRGMIEIGSWWNRLQESMAET